MAGARGEVLSSHLELDSESVPLGRERHVCTGEINVQGQADDGHQDDQGCDVPPDGGGFADGDALQAADAALADGVVGLRALVRLRRQHDLLHVLRARVFGRPRSGGQQIRVIAVLHVDPHYCTHLTLKLREKKNKNECNNP